MNTNLNGKPTAEELVTELQELMQVIRNAEITLQTAQQNYITFVTQKLMNYESRESI